jgi:hypothetical protein
MLIFTPDGQTLFAIADKYLAAYKTSNWSYKSSVGFSEDVIQRKFSPDYQLMAVLSKHFIQIYNTSNFNIERESLLKIGRFILQ